MKVHIQMVYVTWPRWPPCPYMVKTLKNLLLWNQKAEDLESWYVASGARIVSSLFKCMTLTYFTARSNSVPYAFVWERVKTMDFSETIVVTWYEPRHMKTCLRGLRPGITQTGLLSYRSYSDIEIGGIISSRQRTTEALIRLRGCLCCSHLA